MKVLFVALMFSMSVWSAAQAAAPRVVTSIKPVQSLAAGVMDGVGTPEVLIRGSGSLHAYALRPSEAEALNTADVIFWNGPAFETFLEKPLQALGTRARIVTLMQAPGITLLPAREGGLWQDAGETHGSGSDGHIWLDPANAKAIVSAMAETLAAIDTANAARYRSNAVSLQSNLDALDTELRNRLEPVKATPFVVFHDAYQYLEARYGLRALGSITVSAERAAGARRIKQIRDQIGTSERICIFAEPQFEPKLVHMLAGETGAKTAVLDPEGSTLQSGPDLHFNLMRALADNLIACLKAP
jgi:zinc transport system substrate-binding protein